MAKRLLSNDYDRIVLDTFSLPESDFYKYYSNVVEENHLANEDIFQELITAIDRKIEWYRGQTDRGPNWGSDDNNENKTLLNPDETSIPLLPEYGIKRHINKSFFDEQIRIIEGLSVINRSRRLLTDIEDKQVEINELFNQINKPKTTPKEAKTFESLFVNEENAETVIKIFTDEEYLISGKWTYPGNNKSIATPFYVLQDFFGIIKNDTTPQRTKLRIWCNRFGLNANESDLKNLLSNPAKGKNPTLSFRKEQKEFYKLFEFSFTPIRQIEETE